jgi:phosphate-selective porin OprO and OprP
MNHACTMRAGWALALALSWRPVGAASGAPTVQEQLKAMQQALEAQQAQLAAQQQEIEARRAEINALLRQQATNTSAEPGPAIEPQQKAIENLQQAAAKAKLSSQEQPKLSFIANRPTVTSADGRSSISLRALVQMDAAHYDQGAAGTLATDFRRGSVGVPPNRETDAARDLSDGAFFRRARIGVEGVINRAFSFKFVTEFGGSGTEGPARINDAWIAYTGVVPFTVQFGAFSPASNLEDSTAPDDLLFMERSSSAELSRSMGGADGRTGLAVRYVGTRASGSLALTGRTVNDAEVPDSQSALVGRFAGLVATGPDFNVHLGANGTYVTRPADQGQSATGSRYAIRFRDRPEVRVDSTRLIDTGSIDADHAYAAGVEFAGNWRNWLLQGENFWYGIERRSSTLSNPSFSGYYLQGSWVLTGESHRYNPTTGSYQEPLPFVPFDGQGGRGAWELALRYSRIDLNHDAGVAGLVAPADGVRGGLQAITAIGINWYPNANIRFLLDYQHVNVDRLNPASVQNPEPFGPAPATPPVGVNIGQSLNVIALRSQFSL